MADESYESQESEADPEPALPKKRQKIQVSDHDEESSEEISSSPRSPKYSNYSEDAPSSSSFSEDAPSESSSDYHVAVKRSRHVRK